MHVGIDLGSRTIKVAALQNGVLVGHHVRESGFDPQGEAKRLLTEFPAERVVATGYGRHLAQRYFAHEVITEIKAHALGARHHFPHCRTILDVGGQDSKVISLSPDGRVASFQMNDKCAAGTGRFLEMMATVLGFSLAEFGIVAGCSQQDVPINSMCAVFAESEVISLKNRGVAPSDIARAIHLAVAGRLVAMLEKIGFGDHIVFTGGVARNPFLLTTLTERLGVQVAVPEHPEIVGALGAALHGMSQN
jgi:predicted CoA-substrate-specific enzyme activase